MGRAVWHAIATTIAVASCATLDESPRAPSPTPREARPLEALSLATKAAAPAPVTDGEVGAPSSVRLAVQPRPGAYANLDPDDDLVVGPPDARAACDSELAAAGVTYRAALLPVHTPKKSAITCGAPQVVTYLRGPGKIAYSSPPLLTCAMALALASFERIVQTEAEKALHSPVARIDHLGTYSCREIARFPGWVSEHSYANAIDMAAFVLKDGRTITVLRDFDVGDATPTKSSAFFLRAISRRANDEDVFSHVLTPFYDAHHKNHFHLDLSRFRADGTRPSVE